MARSRLRGAGAVLATALVLPAAVVAGATAPSASAAPPPSCSADAATASFTQSTPVAVPTGPAVVTSTVDVSGAGAYLTDVDVTTNLKHTFSADLDVTVTSPSGTVVTLTTDNGINHDNVFDGTVWDDDADPGSQVPYVSNDGLVTDHQYANLTLASPLVPEEALGAFIGEDPNGIWTLTVSDDLAGDGGSIDSWRLSLTTQPTPPVLTTAPSFTQSTPVAVPTGPAVVTSTVDVGGAGAYLADVDVTTNLKHMFSADLDVTVTSPSGTVVTLTTDNGSGNDNVFDGTVWDDNANPGGQVPYVFNDGVVTDHQYVNLTLASPLVPEEALAAFIGEDPNGTWTLTVSDDVAGDGGSLDSWSLDIRTASCTFPPPPPPSDTEVSGAKVKAKKQKVTPRKFAVKTQVSATAEALTATVGGKVKVKLANGKNATYKLAKATKPAPLGGKAALKQKLTGSKASTAAARAAMVEALKAKRSVVVKLKFTMTDAAGNRQVVKRTVKVKKA